MLFWIALGIDQKPNLLGLLQHSIIDILNLSILFFFMQSNGFFSKTALAAGVSNFSSYAWKATYRSERATVSL